MANRRTPAFTKREIKTYSAAAEEAGLKSWSVERQATDGTVTRFIGGSGAEDDTLSESDHK